MFSTMGLAYAAGVHVIIGAFFAGLMLSRAFREDKDTHGAIRLMTFGLFAPIAYAWVGLNTVLTTLAASLLLMVTIVVAGIGAEILGGGLGSKCAGLNWRESLVVGVGLTGRAGIELAVIEAMRLAGTNTPEIYSSFVVLTTIACLLMPVMLKFACAYAWEGSMD
jgi:Kef-type K+ transport system membrane component KefB